MDNTPYPPPPQPVMADSAYPPSKGAPPPDPASQPPAYGQNSGYGTQQPQAGYAPPGGYGTQQPQAGYAPPGGYATGHQPHAGATVHPVGSVGYATTANTVVITQPGAVGYVGGRYPDNTGAIIFSCVVAWCCCCVLGIIAFVYAIMASSSATAEQAVRNLMISNRLSVSGLIAGICLWIFWIILGIIA